MKIGFLILAHRYPNQVIKLIESLLLFKDSKVYIHVDRKSEQVHEALTSRFSENKNVVLIEERYKVYWGSYNQIRATFSLIKSAYKNNTEDYFMLLSGQDFLVKKPSVLTKFLKDHSSKQFVVNFKLPDKQWSDGGLNRLQHYSFDIENHPWFSNKLNSLIKKSQDLLHIKRYVYFEQHGGSNWFNISKEALQYIVKYITENPKYLKAFRYSRCADEMFIQSILLNSKFKNDVVSNDLRYIDWGSGPEYPKILRTEDFEK